MFEPTLMDNKILKKIATQTISFSKLKSKFKRINWHRLDQLIDNGYITHSHYTPVNIEEYAVIFSITEKGISQVQNYKAQATHDIKVRIMDFVVGFVSGLILTVLGGFLLSLL